MILNTLINVSNLTSFFFIFLVYNVLLCLDLDLEIYNISNDNDKLIYYEQVLESLLKEFQDVFIEELPKGLPSKHNIDLIPCSALVNIPLYQLSQNEEGVIASQLKEYLRMGHICYSKSP